MILSLLGIGFLLFGNANKCISSSYFDFNNSSDIDTGLRLSQPLESYNANEIRGLYNFKDTFNFEHNYSDVGVHFEVEGYQHLVPLSLGESVIGYIRYISFDVFADNNDNVESIDVSIIYYLTDNSGDVSLQYNISNYDDVSDLTGEKNIIFNVQSSYFADDEEDYTIFNEVFTTGTNRYITTYTGYYSFNANPSFNNGYIDNVIGSVSVNNRIYTFMSLFENSGLDSSVIQFGYFDMYDLVYSTETYPVKNVTNWVIGVNNIYFNQCKMSLQSYNRLSSLGVFAYVHDSTLDNIGFKELLYNIADSALYFFVSFLNFDLFGFNMFLALSGLATLLIAILVIRKVW